MQNNTTPKPTANVPHNRNHMKERIYLVKTRHNTWELLTEAQYERWLIYG